MEDCHLTESIRILLIASRSMLNIYNMLNQRFNLSIEHMLLCNVYRFLYKENQTFNIVSHCMSITPAPDSSRATLLRLMLNVSYQLDFVTPGKSPLAAKLRIQIRDKRNFFETARARFVKTQRL